MRPRAEQVGAWIALLAAAGCEQIIGLHDRPEATDGGSVTAASLSDGGRPTEAALTTSACGALPTPSSACASCVEQSCCAAAQACAGDPACKEASTCLAGCADDACRAQCAAFYSLPPTLMALRSCRVQKCATACGSTCGESAVAVSSCQTCEQSSCCSQATACAVDTQCAALNLCVSNCFGSSSCPTDCETQYPKGVTDFEAWHSCTNQCATACAPGQSWACLDKPIVWPDPNSVGTVNFSVTFVDFSSEEPFEGAAVKACGKLDFTCASPLATGTTDATGLVSLTVSTGLSGFDGYLDVTGGKVGGTGAAAFPTIWYPVPFVIANGWRGRTEILAPDEFAAITTATGATLDPTRGHIALNAGDCAFSPAAGVSFALPSADSKTVSYYLVGGVPATTANATDQSGIGAFINVPTPATATLAVVSATSGQDQGKSMGSLTFIVRRGTLSTTSLFPPVP